MSLAERKKRWRQKHPEKVRAEKRAWYQRHKEEIKKKAKGYYLRAKNKEEFKKARREYLRKWRAANWERYRANDRRYIKESRPKRRDVFSERDRIHAHRRRVLKIGAKGRHTREQWLGRVEFYGWRCAYCGKHLTRSTLTQDHRVPLVRGGTNWASNLAPACAPCNSKKNKF